MASASAVPVPASHLDAARDAEAATRAANEAMAARLPFDDTRDFEAAKRGLIAPVPEGVVRTEHGTVLWNLGEYAFIDGELAPATVNPSLWRMARLNLANGLFKVAERVYQLRGFDIANMTVLEGDSGLILIDPLTTAEVSRAALALYYVHIGPAKAGGRGDLHPQPHRSLRRRARRDRRGRRQGGQGAR
jgi:alkyl sulfatase BDS1-like metallo-beta-lactamase superfamily hydrolase